MSESILSKRRRLSHDQSIRRLSFSAQGYSTPGSEGTLAYVYPSTPGPSSLPEEPLTPKKLEEATQEFKDGTNYTTEIVQRKREVCVVACARPLEVQKLVGKCEEWYTESYLKQKDTDKEIAGHKEEEANLVSILRKVRKTISEDTKISWDSKIDCVNQLDKLKLCLLITEPLPHKRVLARADYPGGVQKFFGILSYLFVTTNGDLLLKLINMCKNLGLFENPAFCKDKVHLQEQETRFLDSRKEFLSDDRIKSNYLVACEWLGFGRPADYQVANQMRHGKSILLPVLGDSMDVDDDLYTVKETMSPGSPPATRGEYQLQLNDKKEDRNYLEDWIKLEGAKAEEMEGRKSENKLSPEEEKKLEKCKEGLKEKKGNLKLLDEHLIGMYEKFFKLPRS